MSFVYSYLLVVVVYALCLLVVLVLMLCILLYNIHMYFVTIQTMYAYFLCIFYWYLCIAISLFYESSCVTCNCSTHALLFCTNTFTAFVTCTIILYFMHYIHVICNYATHIFLLYFIMYFVAVQHIFCTRIYCLWLCTCLLYTSRCV